jgi:hypothetical protein
MVAKRTMDYAQLSLGKKHGDRDFVSVRKSSG